MPGPLLLDLRDLGINRKGVGRVLEGLTPQLLALDGDRYHVVCTEAALPLLPALARDRTHVVPSVPQSAWEQLGLPAVAARIGAGAVYSHRECGALWGAPLLLHVTEDPEVRWRRDAPTSRRARARYTYSRLLMGRSLRRAQVGASTRAVADHLASTYGVARASITVIPLAVDHRRFHPTPRPYDEPFFFHLASGDPRDRTDVVVEAFARHAAAVEDPVHLVIGGDVGDEGPGLRARASRAGVAHRVHLTGRLSDDELVARYSSAVACVQPSSDEGFGLQPLEVLACGGVLVATPEPSVREVVGDAVALWAEPTVDGLAAAFAAAATEARLRDRARADNPGHARCFTWERTAEIVHQQLCGLAAGRRSA